MDEYIKREAAIIAVTGAALPDKTTDGVPIANGKRSVTDCVRRIKSIPAEDVQPVKWIPVTERLPEENGRYLVVAKRTVDPEYLAEFGDDCIEVRIMRFHDKLRVPFHSPAWINDVITDVVTHWMPLPEPPEDGET